MKLSLILFFLLIYFLRKCQRTVRLFSSWSTSLWSFRDLSLLLLSKWCLPFL